MTKPRSKPKRQAHEATVLARRELSPELVRLNLNAPALVDRELEHTDHYIKLLFVPETADYAWPFDMEKIRESLPRDQHPVTRTYTLRSVDTATGDIEVDFVLHGDKGLAGPWARDAQVGDVIPYMGPGGAWHPEDGYEHFVLAGDESAAPAIAAALENLPAGATADAYVEIAAEGHEFEMPEIEGTTLTWIPRDGATPGTRMSAVVRENGLPEKHTSWFIHGVAEMIKEMRRFLFIDGHLEKSDVSISGYWRLGMTENQWQESKGEFTEEMEREEQAAVS